MEIGTNQTALERPRVSPEAGVASNVSQVATGKRAALKARTFQVRRRKDAALKRTVLELHVSKVFSREVLAHKLATTDVPVALVYGIE